MPPEIPPPQPPIWDHGQRRMALVQSMLADVFNGTLRAGQHLVAQDLADRFGVSQTPIREALITLAGIGVIELQPNRGAIVRPVSEQDVREVCQVRRVLECEAAREACGRIPPGELASIEREIRGLDVLAPDLSAARTADDRLHDTVAAYCGNSLLAREIGRLKLLFRAYRDVSWAQEADRNDYSRVPLEQAEHLDIVRALAGGEPKAAAKAMAAHIRSGERYWTRAVFGLTDAPALSPTTRKKGR